MYVLRSIKNIRFVTTMRDWRSRFMNTQEALQNRKYQNNKYLYMYCYHTMIYSDIKCYIDHMHMMHVPIRSEFVSVAFYL